MEEARGVQLHQLEDPDDPVPFVTEVPIVLEEGADSDTVLAEAAEMGDPTVSHFVEGAGQ